MGTVALNTSPCCKGLGFPQRHLYVGGVQSKKLTVKLSPQFPLKKFLGFGIVLAAATHCLGAANVSHATNYQKAFFFGFDFGIGHDGGLMYSVFYHV